MTEESRITPYPQDGKVLIEAVRTMRRAQGWAVFSVDRELTANMTDPTIRGTMGKLPKVGLTTFLTIDDVDYGIAFFEAAQQVVAQHLCVLREHKRQRGK